MVVLDLRTCDPIVDRTACHGLLRAALARGAVPYTVHPGDWDWWCFHRDGSAQPPVLLIGARILVDFERATGELSVFGATPDELLEIAEHFGSDVLSIGWILADDSERIAALEAAGFAPDGEIPGPVFARDPAGGIAGLGAPPPGIEIRPLAGDAEVPARSAAARRAFGTAMEPERHVARYRAFTQSPAYDRTRDIVAVDGSGRVAAFAIHWIDTALSLAQLEPVGTDPDFARRGLGRAVIADTLARLAGAGVRTVRVLSNGDNPAAIGLYESCGFVEVGRLSWFRPVRRQ